MAKNKISAADLPGGGTPYGGEQARAIAEVGIFLRVRSGSEAHGLSIETGDDDEMGLCLTPIEYVVGLKKVIGRDGKEMVFDRYEFRSAWARGGQREKSTIGDLDLVVYDLRTWAALALKGNPASLLPLYVADADVLVINEVGQELRANRDKFVSKSMAEPFYRYLLSQKNQMTGEKPNHHVVRQDLVDKHGYDVKFAAHAIRLGLQGLEMLSAGTMTLPMPEPDRERVRAVRRGEVSFQDALAWIQELEAKVAVLEKDNDLPEQPDHEWVDDFIARSYLKYWSAR